MAIATLYYRLTAISSKSSNPENPDMATPPKIIQQHPVNPQILKILILTKSLSNVYPISKSL